MTPRIIKTKKDHDAALNHIASLMDSALSKPQRDELELWAALVQSYEREAYPIDPPDPIEAIRFRMEQAGLNQQDLVPYIGSKSKVSEVLSGLRPLSLKMIRALHEGLGIRTDILLNDKGRRVPNGRAGSRSIRSRPR